MRSNETGPKVEEAEPLCVLLSDRDLDNYSAICRVCDRHRWQFRHASDRKEAIAFLSKASFATVITEPALPGGEPWQLLLEEFANLSCPSVIIIAARVGDEALWAEVLNLGGYDVLAIPLDEDEVDRVLSGAYYHLMFRRKSSGHHSS